MLVFELACTLGVNNATPATVLACKPLPTSTAEVEMPRASFALAALSVHVTETDVMMPPLLSTIATATERVGG